MYTNPDGGKVHPIFVLMLIAVQHALKCPITSFTKSHIISILLQKCIISRCLADTFLDTEVHSPLIWPSLLQFLKIANKFGCSYMKDERTEVKIPETEK
jgi:hypothetical protein